MENTPLVLVEKQVELNYVVEGHKPATITLDGRPIMILGRISTHTLYTVIYRCWPHLVAAVHVWVVVASAFTSANMVIADTL